MVNEYAPGTQSGGPPARSAAAVSPRRRHVRRLVAGVAVLERAGSRSRTPANAVTKKLSGLSRAISCAARGAATRRDRRPRARPRPSGRLAQRHEERRRQALARHVGHDEERRRSSTHEAIVEVAADACARARSSAARRSAARRRAPRGRAEAPSGCAAPPRARPPARAAASRSSRRWRSASESVAARRTANASVRPIAGHAASSSTPRENAHRPAAKNATSSAAAAPTEERTRDAGTSQTRMPAPPASSASSSQSAQSGRTRYVPSKICSISCACISTPGNLLAERRRLVVEEAQPGDAEEHELRAQELRVGLAGEELRGGHEARRVVPAVAQPHRAVPLHRDRRAGELHAQQAVARVAQRELVRAGPDAPELERERRNRRCRRRGRPAARGAPGAPARRR